MYSRVNKDRRKTSAGQPNPVVRRAFSMQEADAQLIDALRVRCAAQGMLLNQSEIVRVGLHVLANMDDLDLKDRASKLERLAQARPR